MNYKEKVIALLNSRELSKEQKEKLEDIFPELREGKDGGIRKKLCKAIWTYFPYEEAQKYIAWLETEGKALDSEKVIEWIKENVPMFYEVPCSTNRIIDKFKWDFEL